VTAQLGSGPVERAREPGGLAREGDDEVAFTVLCFDRRDGRLLWEHELAAEAPLTAVHPMHNLASPSPTTDGERLIAWFGSGQLVALDFDGGRLWQRNLAAENSPFELRWGHGSSPVLSGDLLFLLCDHDPSAYLLAVDKRTGKDVWKADRGSGLRSYSTPLVIDAGGRFWSSPVAAAGRIYLLDDAGETVVLAAGPRFEVLARNALGEAAVASPAIAGGRLFVRTERHLFAIGGNR
jgi:outer membrane protein assembly factor BamB